MITTFVPLRIEIKSNNQVYKQTGKLSTWTKTRSNCPHLGGGDAVDKGGLLETLVTESDGHLPAVTAHLVNQLDGRPVVVHLVLDVQVHVFLERLDLRTDQQLGYKMWRQFNLLLAFLIGELLQKKEFTSNKISIHAFIYNIVN